MPQSFASLHCHIIFSTKNRSPSISAQWQPRLYDYMGGIFRNHDCRLRQAECPTTCIYSPSLGRTISVADAVRLVKTNSSAWIHEELGVDDFQWQAGYGAFAVSYSNIEQVKTYLAGQAEHHRRMTFQEEFLELLRRHEIEWDERYVWD